MGTNYYISQATCPNPCAHCSADSREWHIGKNMCMVQAYAETPWGPVTSWADWCKILREQPNLRVWGDNGYGDVMDIEVFIGEWAETPPGQRMRQYRWVRDNAGSRGYYPRLSNEPPPADLDPREWPQDWLDGEDYSVTLSEFS